MKIIHEDTLKFVMANEISTGCLCGVDIPYENNEKKHCFLLRISRLDVEFYDGKTECKKQTLTEATETIPFVDVTEGKLIFLNPKTVVVRLEQIASVKVQSC